MPKLSVGRDRLFHALGRTYTQDEFDELCSDFGIELDDVTTEKAIISKEKHLDVDEVEGDEEVIYKIEIPANRYDLLCFEGIVQALRIFLGNDETPTYKVSNIPRESMLKLHVKPETSLIRPFVVCAVLRGITFDEERYKSFIDLQDKLHTNICRRRTLVAIGTHDLDTVEGPFTYEALPPADINFVPLKQVKSFRADELMKFYEVEFRSACSSTCIRTSQFFPDLSITYSIKNLSFGIVDLGLFPNVADKFGISLGASMGQLPTYIIFDKGLEIARFPEVDFEGKSSHHPITKKLLCRHFELDRRLIEYIHVK